jgi:hypothetical protein
MRANGTSACTREYLSTAPSSSHPLHRRLTGAGGLLRIKSRAVTVVVWELYTRRPFSIAITVHWRRYKAGIEEAAVVSMSGR